MQFSVLMSIYKKENPAYFSECIKSLAQQTLQPDEIVLIEDGKLTDELERVVSEFQNLCPQLTVYRYEENRGLGKALVKTILAQEPICRLKGILVTDDAFSLYEPFGFVRDREIFMKKVSPLNGCF